VKAAVHLRGARTVADAAHADRLGQADRAQEGAVGRLDPDRDLRPLGGREVEDDGAFVRGARGRRPKRHGGEGDKTGGDKK
jgi:hypothetical protein